jgi:hypothetical protein
MIKDQITQLKSQLVERSIKIQRHPYTPAGFFLGGFIFDILTLSRIDSGVQIVQISGYMLILSILVYWKVLFDHQLITIPQKLERIWKHHDLMIQFMMGAMLSVYTLFFFKSASLVTSIVFMAFIAVLMVMNEFIRLEKHQLHLTLTLYFLCLACYWITLVPVFLGFIGFFPFFLALVATGLCAWIFHKLIKKRVLTRATEPDLSIRLRKKISLPTGGVLLALLFFYYFQLIPPVPLSIQYMGIFRDVKKQNNQYVLTYSRSFWRFWQNGDQTFYARPGDVIVAYVQIFAPENFKDQLMVHWKLKTPRGWQDQGSIPIRISGGRSDGFRAYTTKSNYQPGDYRVQIETTDGREVGRIGLEIIADQSTEPRELKQIFK